MLTHMLNPAPPVVEGLSEVIVQVLCVPLEYAAISETCALEQNV